MYDISFRQIEYFLQTASSGSISKAAQLCFTSQSVVSKWIKRMEIELDVALFKRGKSGVSLTEEGKLLEHRLRPIFDDMCACIDSLRELGGEHGGSLRIGCPTGFEYDGMLPRLISNIEKYKDRFPEAQVSVVFHGFRELREKLLSGELDIVFSVSFDIAEEHGISKRPVDELRVYIVVPANHKLAKRDSLSLYDLRDEQFFIMSPNETEGGADIILRRCREAGFTPKRIQHVPNLSSLSMAIKQGRGVTLCGREIAFGAENMMKLYSTDDLPLDSYIIMAWKTKNLRPAVQRFIEEYRALNV